MTEQEVIKKFMAALNAQNYTTAKDALDEAVKYSSRYSGIQDAIDNFLADQKTAERAAIKTILENDGNYKDEYEGKQLSELLEMAETDTTLAAALNNTAKYDSSIHYGTKTFTATKRIRMLTANTFLQDYCGIILERYVFLDEDGDATYYPKIRVNGVLTDITTGNVDTGAITGSDAGTDNEKNPETIVQEIGNKYTAKTSAPQIISTGTNDWIVSATAAGDTIYSGGADSIEAGSGADFISVESNAATISTGAADNYADTVSIGENVKTVCISNFDEFDTLKIDGNFFLASATLDSNDAVTITDVTGKRVFIINGWSTSQDSTVIVNGKTFIFGNWLSDFISYTPPSTSNTAETETSTASAISVDLSEVTSIGGSFSLSGNSSTYSADSSSGTVGEVSTEFPNLTTFTTHGLTVELWGEATDSEPKVSGITTLTADTMSTEQKTVFAGLYKWWIKEGLKLNEDSFGVDFNSNGVTGTNIKVFFYTDTSSNNLAFVRNYYSGNDLELGINMAHFSTILADNENGSATITDSYGNSVTHYLDRTIAHELNHAIFAANVSNFNSLPQFFKEGLAEVVHGIDDERVTLIWNLASGATGTLTDGTTVERLAYALDLDTTSGSTSDPYAGGYMFLRYLAKQAASQTESLPALGDVTVRVSLTGADNSYYSNLTSTGTERATTVESSSRYFVGVAENHNYDVAAGIRQQIYVIDNESWNFTGITSNNTLVSGGGADNVTLGGEYNNISLGGGNDLAYVVGNNNTITGGDGKDTVSIYSEAINVNISNSGKYISVPLYVQNVTVTDFDFSNDLIYIPTSVSNVSYSGNSVILDNTAITLDNIENITDALNMNIRSGRYTRTLANMLGVSTFNWSAGEYYFLAENDTVNIASGEYVFSSVPASAYAKVTIDRNKNITLDFSEDSTISVTPPDNNSHTWTVGSYSCQFTGAATFIGASATGGNFTVSGDFYFYENGTAKTMTYSGNGSVAVYLGDTLTISGLTDGASVSITDGTNTETYTASGDYIFKEIATAENSGGAKISEDIYVYQTAYTSGDILSADYSTFVNHYVNDYQNKTVTIYAGSINLANHSFEIISANDNGITLLYDSSGENLIGISNFEEGESISIDGETYTVANGKITRSDEKIYSGDWNAFISNISNDDYWQVVTDFNDTIISAEKYITGTDAAENFSVNNVTVNGGGVLNIDAAGGNDTISVDNLSINSGYLTFSGSSDNDSISVSKVAISSGNMEIGGGSGTDIIALDGVTISGSEIDAYGDVGADTISAKNISVGSGGNFYVVGNYGEDNLSVENVTIGGGNVYVRGDNSNDTISVENVTVSGSNLEISGGEGAEIISVKNIIGNGKVSIYGDSSTADTSDGDDLIYVTDSSDVQIYSGGGTDTLIFGGTVTATIGDFSAYDIISLSSAISSGSFDGGILTLGNVKLTLSGVSDISDYEGVQIYNGDTKTTLGDLLSAKWIVSNGVATYGNNLITVSGLSTSATADDISLDGTTVTISANALTQNNTVTISDGYTLALADDVTTPSVSSASWSVSSGTANYTAGTTTAGYVLSNNQIVYKAASSGETLITITGLSTAATVSDITLDGTTVTIAARALSASNTVTITDGYTLALGSDVRTPETGSASWSVKSGTANYTAGDSTAGYVISNNQIVYQRAASGETLITITGLSTSATVDDISLEDTTVTISAHALNQNKTVEISDGYTLALAEDVTTPETEEDGWSVSRGTANYITGATTAGYVLSDNKITYQSAGSGETLITVTGLNAAAVADDISLDGTTVTISAHALNQNKTVTISDGYTLALADDVTIPVVSYKSWSVSRGTANYFAGSASAGYVVSDNQIIYKDATDGETLITITGLNTVATVDDISLKNTTVTIAAHGLHQRNTVEISDGYTLALDSDVTISETTEEGWEVSSGTANYQTAAQSAGYILEDNKISYVSETAAKTLVTVTGLKTSARASQLSLDGKTVTILAAAVNKGELKITNGYALTLAKGSYSGVSVIGGAAIDTINQNGNNAVISTGTGNDLITLGGGTSKNTVDAGAGNDIITIGNNSANNVIIGGAGNDSVTVTKSKNIYKYANGDGNDTISGWTEKDTLQITSGSISSWSVKDSDLTFKIGSGAITILDGVGMAINLIETTSTKAVTYYYDKNLKYNAKKTAVTLTSGYSGSYNETISSVVTIDGAAATSAISVTGNAKNNSVSGGSGADTLHGGKGNDTLIGNSGKDVFIFNKSEGNDVITDYTAGTDKISIGADYSASVKSKDVVFKVGTNTLTVKNGAGEKITVNDETFIYESGKIYNGDKTAVTLTSAFKGTLESGIVTADGSTLTGALRITGNTSNNTIYGGKGADSLSGLSGSDLLEGGKGNDTLSGGAGNDTLAGGDGSNVFVYESGNDYITDYTVGKDKIKFAEDITGFSIKNDNLILKNSSGSVTVIDGAGEKITTINSSNKSATQIYYDGYTFNDKKTAVTLTSDYSGSYNETVSSVVTIDGAAATSAISITGNSKANKISGGSGADTLNGGAGNDTLTGNGGKDIFIFEKSKGNDVITDYTAGTDKISIGADYSASVKSKDVVFKVGTNTLTVKNSSGEKITVNDETFIYESGKIYDADKTAVTLTSAFRGTLESGIVTADGSTSSGKLTVIGNSSNNTIYGGKVADSLSGAAGNDWLEGGKGNDTLTGGAGNDTLTGDDGNDTFIFESGNDFITDYKAGADKIKFTAEISGWNISGNDVVFETAGGSVTVQNGAGQKITVVNYKNVTSKETYSAASAQTFDLLEDNNFISDVPQISDIAEITADNYSAGKIDTENYLELAQDKNILAYSKEK